MDNWKLGKLIALSILITTIISAVGGFALSPVMGGWLHAFVFTFLLQMVGNYFYNDYRYRKSEREQRAYENDRLEILSKNLITFKCPCGNNVFEQPVYPGLDNVFECQKCNQTVKLDITITPVVVTTPLTSNPLDKIKDISGNV